MNDWNNTFLHIAETFAKQSTCVKRQVGAVLVKDLRILSTGYNGTPTGFVNCCDVFTSEFGCLNGLKMTHHEFADMYEIHAEQNCLSFAAKNGISCKDTTLYVTTAPCVNCAKVIIASGVTKVVYKDSYKNNLGLNLLKVAKVEVLQVK